MSKGGMVGKQTNSCPMKETELAAIPTRVRALAHAARILRDTRHENHIPKIVKCHKSPQFTLGGEELELFICRR